MSKCANDVALWTRSNCLHLNTAKTEMLWCATRRRQHQIPREPTRVGTDFVQSVRSVRDLGIYLDSDASMKAHVCRTVSSCFNVLRQICSIRRSVTSLVLQSLVVSLVLSRLDYGNAALAGLPTRELSRLQSVQNAGAQLIFSANKYDHVSSLLRDLHWLRPPLRIDYKIAVLVYRCLRGLFPAYLSVDLQSIKDLPSRQRLRSWLSNMLAVPMSNLSTVGDRAFPIAAATSLEHSVASRSVIQFFINFQTSAQD